MIFNRAYRSRPLARCTRPVDTTSAPTRPRGRGYWAAVDVFPGPTDLLINAAIVGELERGEDR